MLYGFYFFMILLQGMHIYDLQAGNIEPVKQQSMSTHEWIDEDWPNESFSDYLNRCMDYQTNLQPFKKFKLAWNIAQRYLKRYYKWNEPHHNSMHNDKISWLNLQILRGESDNETNLSIVHAIDRTKTALGHVILRSWVAQPTNEYKLLQHRQACVRYLIDNIDLYNQLEELYTQFISYENLLLSFALNDPLEQAANRHYWKLTKFPAVEEFLNASPTILTTSFSMERIQQITSVGMMAATAALLPTFGISRLFANSLAPTDSKFDQYSRSLVGTGGPIFGPLSSIQNSIIQAGVFIAAGVYCGLKISDDYDWARDNFTLSMCLQTKLFHVRKALEIIEKVGLLLEHHPDFLFQQDFSITKLREEFVNQEATTQKLLTLLASDTFKNPATAITHWGEILVAYKLVHKHIYDLEDMIYAFGQLDVYMSIARLVKEFEYDKIGYSFAHYTQKTGPQLTIKNGWTPLLNKQQAVPNSIELGTPKHGTGIILTGPNEGGKSTFVKSIATNIILAQSIGIAAADTIEISPFAYIATYLNITDEHGKSLFEAQVERIKQILDRIDQLDHNQYAFVIIDELFNGTSAQVGQAASLSVANYITQKTNVLSMFPTHFEKLTELEKNGHCANYQVSAEIKENGIINYSYIVKPGASHQNIVIDIMKNEAFNQNIIDQIVEQLHM